MTKIQDVFNFLCGLAPLELQCSFDNAGFQIGRSEREVKKALLAPFPLQVPLRAELYFCGGKRRKPA